MIKFYPGYSLLTVVLLMMFSISSCKKDGKTVTPSGIQPIATLGLYELGTSDNTARRVYLPITQVGTQAGSWYSVFDTGSSGMTIDAAGILPAAMITDNGIVVPGDSVTVNGITVTTQEATLSYGDATGETQESGNLAYAPVTIGDKNGNYTIKRIPIFLYYKVVNLTTGVKQAAHSNDVFGVGPGVNFGSLSISSPLSYITGSGTTPGFKLGILNANSFSTTGTYVSKLLTIGLVPDDFTASSGFVLHPLGFSSVGGYSPDIPAIISYNGQTENGTLLFDTGTPSLSTIENSAASGNEATLPANTKVSVTTSQGFTYSYTTSATLNSTQVANPKLTLDPRTIFSIDFFISNEYLMDYSGHRIGLKNN
jgi:hypothetical protein